MAGSSGNHTGSKEKRTWALLLASTLLVSSQTVLAIVGFPGLAQDWSLSATQLGLLLGATPFAAALACLLAGPLADRAGRRRILLAGQATFAGGLAAHALAIDLNLLLLMRVVTGIGAGFITALPVSYLTDQHHRDRHHPLISRALSGHALGHAVAIPLGILAMQSWSILQINTIAGLAAGVVLALQWRHLPADTTPAPAATTNHPTRGAWAAPEFYWILTAGFFGIVASALTQTTLSLWLLHGLALQPVGIATVFLVGGLLQFIMMLWVIPRWRRHAPWTAISASFLIHALVLGFWAQVVSHLAAAYVCFALAMGAVAWRIAPTHYLVAHAGPSQTKGTRGSVNQTTKFLGRSLGGFLGSALFFQWSAAVALGCATGLLLLGAGLLFWRQYWSSQPTAHSLRKESTFTNADGAGTRSAELKMSRKQSYSSVPTPARKRAPLLSQINFLFRNFKKLIHSLPNSRDISRW